ncbi:MAG: caspase family protein [Bacteroidota bacterium]
MSETQSRAVEEEDFDPEVSGEQQIKHNYMLAIAVNHYLDDQIDDLSNCVRDIENLVEVLTKDYFFDYGNIHFLRNRLPALANDQADKEKGFAYVGDASHENIIARLKHFAQTMTTDDNLIICYSGHGIPLPKWFGRVQKFHLLNEN